VRPPGFPVVVPQDSPEGLRIDDRDDALGDETSCRAISRRLRADEERAHSLGCSQAISTSGSATRAEGPAFGRDEAWGAGPAWLRVRHRSAYLRACRPLGLQVSSNLLECFASSEQERETALSCDAGGSVVARRRCSVQARAACAKV
jgi:hypothetical protein